MEETNQQPLALRVCAELAGSFLLCFAIYAFSKYFIENINRFLSISFRIFFYDGYHFQYRVFISSKHRILCFLIFFLLYSINFSLHIVHYRQYTKLCLL